MAKREVRGGGQFPMFNPKAKLDGSQMRRARPVRPRGKANSKFKNR